MKKPRSYEDGWADCKRVLSVKIQIEMEKISSGDTREGMRRVLAVVSSTQRPRETDG